MKKTLQYIIASLFAIAMVFGLSNKQAMAKGLTPEEIQEKGVLTVGTSADYPPYEFHAMVDGQDKIVGFDIAFAQHIADDLGVDLKVEDLGFDVLLASLESGKTDMIIAGMTYTEDRAKSVDFTDEYYVDGPAFVTRLADADKLTSKDIIDSEDYVVGAQVGSTEELKAEQLEHAGIYKLNDIAQLIIALKTNRIDAVLMTSATAAAYVANDSALSSFDTDFPAADNSGDGKTVALPKDSPELVAYMNNEISDLKADGMFERWLTEAAALTGSEIEASDNVAEDATETAAEETSASSIITQYWPYFWQGIKTTLFISLISVFIGFVLGFLLAVMRLSNNFILKAIATAYVEFIRGTPMLIQVTFMYFGLGMIVNVSAITTGIIAVALNSGAYVCEIIRSGLSSVAKGQTEAARSLGLSSSQTMKEIIFPQAVRNIWPALGNEFVTIIKESSIVSTIGVAELTFQTNLVQSMSYRGLIPLFISMVLYFIMTYSLTKLLNYMERRMHYDNA